MGTGDSAEGEQEETRTAPNNARSPRENILNRRLIKIILPQTRHKAIAEEQRTHDSLYWNLNSSTKLMAVRNPGGREIWLLILRYAPYGSAVNISSLLPNRTEASLR